MEESEGDDDSWRGVLSTSPEGVRAVRSVSRVGGSVGDGLA